MLSRVGTGSTPPSWKGWQRQTRRTASQLPFHGPQARTASSAYSEHDGVKRQLGASKGEMSRR